VFDADFSTSHISKITDVVLEYVVK